MPAFDPRRGKPPPAEPTTQRRALAALLVALLSLTGVLALGAPQRGVLLVGYALLAGFVALWMAVIGYGSAEGPSGGPSSGGPSPASPAHGST